MYGTRNQRCVYNDKIPNPYKSAEIVLDNYALEEEMSGHVQNVKEKWT